MARVIEDLDRLLPESVNIKVSGKILELKPIKLKALLGLQKTFEDFRDLDPSEYTDDTFDKLLDALAVVLPEIKTDPDIDLTIPQLIRLINLVAQLMTVQSNEMTQAGMNVSIDKKKVLKEQLELSHTS